MRLLIVYKDYNMSLRTMIACRKEYGDIFCRPTVKVSMVQNRKYL